MKIYFFTKNVLFPKKDLILNFEIQKQHFYKTLRTVKNQRGLLLKLKILS